MGTTRWLSFDARLRRRLSHSYWQKASPHHPSYFCVAMPPCWWMYHINRHSRSRHATPQAMWIAHDFGKPTEWAGNYRHFRHGNRHWHRRPHRRIMWFRQHDCRLGDRNWPHLSRVQPKLARQIAEKGLIISEFPPGTRPLAGNFPRRNRIIAAQSHAVLVVEAALESGSLIYRAASRRNGAWCHGHSRVNRQSTQQRLPNSSKKVQKLVECLEEYRQRMDTFCQTKLILNSKAAWKHRLHHIINTVYPQFVHRQHDNSYTKFSGCFCKHCCCG